MLCLLLINSIPYPTSSDLRKNVYSQETSITGTWRGQSLCVDPATGCHDEDVFYHITQETGSATVKIDADKIIDGKAVNMGELVFTYDKAKGMLVSKVGKSLWQLTIKGNQINGVLLREGSTIRKVTLKKE